MEALNITPEQLKSGSRSEADDGLCQATLEKIAYRVARILRLVGQLPRIPMGTYVPPNKKTHRWFMTCFMAELAYRLEQVLSHLMTFPQDNYPVNDLNLDLDAEADRFPRD